MARRPDNPSAHILIVDDEEESASALGRILGQIGYTAVRVISNGHLTAERCLEFNPDLILLDLHMEPVSGFAILSRIHELMSRKTRPPVLVVTADTTLEAKHEALAAGATDFLTKPLDPVEIILRIENLLTARNLFQQCQLYSEGLERLVSKRTLELQQQTIELENMIDELCQTQQQVVQQERMRALATMASGIAHDLNNGLFIILGFGHMLLRDTERFPENSRERKHLQEMVLAGSDNAALVDRLRQFCRPCSTRERREAVELNEVIEQTISLTAPKWQSHASGEGATISIEKELGDIPAVCGAPDELREVLTNLILNGVDAMPNGGRIIFRTRLEEGSIRMEISDTGIGMTEPTRLRCLEPFFTTKGEGGSGLGLAMSYGIIRRHSGTIEVQSEINKGTTFTIHLPVLTKNIQVENGEAGRRLRALRILVVDDQPAIREILSAYLAEDQHIVETAAEASDAIEKFGTGRFDLVITDRAMPKMNGDELAASIKKIHPGEPVIMLTGFADLTDENVVRSGNIDLVLSKPARLNDLRRAIFEVMVKHPAH